VGQEIKKSALIGYTGFVGRNILRAGAMIDEKYSSTNIADIRGKEFDLLICAGTRGSRRGVNENPNGDLEEIKSLMEQLKRVKVDKLVLISTVEVYNYHNRADEDYDLPKDMLPPYALHRYYLEEFCRTRFDYLIVRLPIIFGVGLKKNIIYDLLKGHYNFTHKDNIYQFYDLANIWNDIQKSIQLDIKIVNLFSEPIAVRELAWDVFHIELTNTDEPLRQFDILCKYWRLWNGVPGYLYSKRDIYSSLEKYIADRSLLS